MSAIVRSELYENSSALSNGILDMDSNTSYLIADIKLYAAACETRFQLDQLVGTVNVYDKSGVLLVRFTNHELLFFIYRH